MLFPRQETAGNRRRYRPDLAAANGISDDVSVVLGGAGGSIGPATNLAAGSFPFSVVEGDFDGDPESAGNLDT